MHLTLRRAWATLVTATSVIATGCASDPTAPPGPAASAPTIGDFRPSVQVAGGGQRRVFKGRHGRTFTVDHATARVSDDSGHTAQLNDRQLQMVERSLDDLAAFEARLARLQRDPGFRGRMERASHSPRKLQLRTRMATPPAGKARAARAGLAPTSAPARASSALRPGSPSFSMMSDACTDLELAIYATTQAYDNAVNQFEENFALLAILGWGWDASGGYGWTFDRYISQLAAWEVNQAALASTISMLRVQLDIMAVQYDMMGCWDQPPEEPGTGTPGTGGNPGTGGGGGGGLTCHEEYVIVEESYDGGRTWYVVWEGYAEICE